jgi:cytochrome c553
MATNGEGDNDKYYPRVHGQHYNYIVRQFKEIKGGKRRNANPEMVEQVKNFSDRDVLAVSDYTSRIKPPKELLAESADWKNPDFQ